MVHNTTKQLGLTLIELIITMAIMSILISITAVSLGHTQQTTSTNSVLATFLADWRQQQLKAMVADTDGRTAPDTYGLYIERNQYTLFHGNSPTTDPATNVVVSVPTPVTFAVSSPVTVVFARILGTVTETPVTSSFTLQNSLDTASSRTLQFNQYGVITQVN